MYIFFPKGFTPDESVRKQAERLCGCDNALLWIEDPDGFPDNGKYVSAVCPGCLAIGGYRLYLSEMVSSDTAGASFKGSFMHRNTRFATSEIRLDAESGTFTFSITSTESVDAFEALGAGIRYIMPDDLQTNSKFGRSSAYFINQVLKYTGNKEFNVTLCPSALFDTKKTFITIPDESFSSNLTDLMKNAHKLRPKENASLVFARYASSVYRDSKTKKQNTAGYNVYLTFNGSFAVENAKNPAELLFGLYGMEYMRGCDKVIFCPGYSAFLGDDFPDGDGQTTAWVSLCGDYFSCPESMPLYAPKDGILQIYESPAAVFANYSQPVPFFPWTNARFSENLDVANADNILYKQRERILSGNIKNAQLNSSGDGEIVAVTPTGLCAGIDGTAWNWLGIAQTSDEPFPNIKICGITPEAKEKLLQKDCFIVISSKEEYKKFGTGEITIAADGWRTTISENNWDDAILIIKYNTGISVREKLAGNKKFEELLNGAYENAKEKESYAGFLETVSSERFEGIMLLNARAYPDYDKLSPDVGGVVSMTRAEYLKCVYAAVSRSRVDMPDGALKIMRSQTDALIVYDSEGIVQSQSDYTCKTAGVEAVIKDSRMESFSSRTEILPKTLLGERMNDPQRLVMLGRSEVLNDVTVYRFVFENSVRYIPVEKPVEAVSITNVSMTASNGKSRFTLSGNIAFANEKECDIFSYDELAFEGDAIVSESDTAYEDLSALSFCAERSKTRENSVVGAFGMAPLQYVSNSAKASPDELGFSSITAPVLQGEISVGWNGIIHRVSIGNSGELGANSPLYFDLIFAWSDGKYYFGTRMGDVFSREFSLQNLLNVGFKSVSLTKPADKPPIFKLNSLTLKMLGLSVPRKSADLFIFGEGGKTGWFFGYSE